MTQTAYFAGGCYWGVEYYFAHAPGVVSTRVGFMGGTIDHPTYQQVTGGGTGHVETMEVVFDPAMTSYRELVIALF